jgi:hypothetical protein
LRFSTPSALCASGRVLLSSLDFIYDRNLVRCLSCGTIALFHGAHIMEDSILIICITLAAFLIVSAFLLPPLYQQAAANARLRFPTLRNKRICLVIAHPDDEAMFFAPTVLGLANPDTGNHVKILCLSTGDAEGLGETRKQELKKSAKLLGLRSEEDVLIIDSP